MEKGKIRTRNKENIARSFTVPLKNKKREKNGSKYVQSIFTYSRNSFHQSAV